MKILIQGCGAQGVAIAGQLAKEKDVERLVLADIDSNKGKGLREQIKSLQTDVELRSILKKLADRGIQIVDKTVSSGVHT